MLPRILDFVENLDCAENYFVERPDYFVEKLDSVENYFAERLDFVENYVVFVENYSVGTHY